MSTSQIQAPLRAMQAMKDEMRAEYGAMQPSRFRRRRPGASSLGGGADAHLGSEWAFFNMMEYVRAMDRDDAFIGRIVDVAVEQTTQTGFSFDPDTQSNDLNKYLREFWYEWSSDADLCDIAGEMTYADYTALSFRHELVDGDFMSAVTRDGPIESFEGDRCRTPSYARNRNIVLGIELDANRRRQRYYMTRSPGAAGKLKLDQFAPIEVRDQDGYRQLMHLYDPTRVSMTRSVTAFHAIFDIAGMFEDTHFALVIKQQMAACIGQFLEQTDTSGKVGDGNDLKVGDRVVGPRGADIDTVESLSPGLLIRGKPGQKLANVGQQVPSNETMEHMRFLLQTISVNLGVPISIVLLEGRDMGNFGAMRAAMDQAKLGFKFNQERLINRLHRPNWKAKVRQWLAENRKGIQKYLTDGVDPFYCKIKGPRWPYMQPLDDAKSKSHKIHNLLSSRRRENADDGNDLDEIIDETIRDNASAITKAIGAAKKIKETTGVEVHWKEVLPLEMPSSTLAAEQAAAAKEKAAQGQGGTQRTA